MKSEKILKIKTWMEGRSKTRTMVILWVVFLLIVIAARAWWGSHQSDINDEASGREETLETAALNMVTLDAAAQRNIGLRVEAAQTRTMLQAIQTTGSVGPNETRVAHIRPLARGRIEKVYVRLGDRVHAGQPLVAYDNIELGELVGEYRQDHLRERIPRSEDAHGQGAL